MKNLNLLLSVAIITLIATSFQSRESEKSEGFIGQVIYSMMPPEIFITENPEWVLMDGREVEGSEYHRLTGSIWIPNAQNQFIRGTDGKYNSANGYKNGYERTVGSAQGYSTAMPLRKFKFNRLEETGKQDCWTTKYKEFVQDWDKFNSNASIIDCTNSYKQVDVSGGDSETRPANITLYIYMKIN